MDGRVLLVDVSMAPLAVITWMKAVTLLWTEKAETLEAQDAVVRSPSVTMVLPSVLKLRRHVRGSRHGPRLSRRHIFYRDDYRCQYCRKQLPARELNLDHVIPRSRGGRTTWDNVVTCCRSCNISKGGRTPREARLKLAKRPVRPAWTLADEIMASHSAVPEVWAKYLQWYATKGKKAASGNA